MRQRDPARMLRLNLLPKPIVDPIGLLLPRPPQRKFAERAEGLNLGARTWLSTGYRGALGCVLLNSIEPFALFLSGQLSKKQRWLSGSSLRVPEFDAIDFSKTGVAVFNILKSVPIISSCLVERMV
jgi:hypothetical protein